MTGPFISSKLWITQAREDLSDFAARERAVFNRESAYRFFEDVERQPGAKVIGIKLSPAPETLSTRAANIVNALRSALDQAAWRASIELGAKESAKIYFPLAGTKANFEDMFRPRGSCKNIPAELHPLLKGFEGYPRSKDYPGGNDLLYALSAISNPNKHKETYKVGINLTGDVFANHIQFRLVRELSFPPRFDPSTNEITLAVLEPGGSYFADITFPAYIAFGEVPIVARHPVVPVLNEMTRIADGIINSIEAETARILSERT
ncbi:hypothetical protein I6F35_12250 [Bradyrhizobium sp. BRP22]|uniref:hypothetical protein n=1 Tax=Bradyrhizobium sp. BRP22 TaxID=2793821 RepID=UPI001CD45B2D|nr:hypothetical protein [Bradyrhizobium sp. BRP22]MCA1453983.1 hypothetical protein [Bradyrhizobium sp. BRP22]